MEMKIEADPKRIEEENKMLVGKNYKIESDPLNVTLSRRLTRVVPLN